MTELRTIKEKFSLLEELKLLMQVLNYDIEETIHKESVIITITLQGYIKRALSSVKPKKEVVKERQAYKLENETLWFKHFQ